MLRFKHVWLVCEYGDEQFAVKTARSVENDTVALRISYENGRFSASLHAKTDAEITVRMLRAEFQYQFRESDRIFLNGYQSWTDSTEHAPDGVMAGLGHIPRPLIERYAFRQYGDYRFTKYSCKRGELHGWSYGYIRNGLHFDFAGSLNEDAGFTCLRTNTGAETVHAEKDCEGLRFTGDYSGLQLQLLSGTEDAVFDGYFAALGVQPSPAAKPLTGYTSWYRHYQNISRDVILHDLEGIRTAEMQPDVFQIDDGWQTAVGDWCSVDPVKFPGGMREIADAVRSQGMTPGLWLAPFVCEEKSEIYLNHKNWLVLDDRGRFVRGGSNWSGFYALNLYNAEVRAYLKTVFDTVVREWGYGLLKLDFLYAVCIQPHSGKTRGQIMADAMSFLRELAGEVQILGCGVPLASAFGKAEYCRIGCDVSLDWNDKPYMQLMHRERISTRNSILNSVFRRQLNGRAFLNDPDVYLLRSDNTALTERQKRCLSEVNALCGSVLFTSDDAGTYTPEQKRLLHHMLALRDAKLISAERTAKELTLCFTLNGRQYKRVYPL
ncbi:MAG: alpha-galactosidase [Oscillospiraceae bacterium]|nr:alpha-galactosidase [Oscillospiraceae bacterium]